MSSSNPRTLSMPRLNELRTKERYIQHCGSATDVILMHFKLVRIIQHSASVDEEEARSMVNNMYKDKAIRLCQHSGIIVVEDPEVKEMVSKYEREVPEHECDDGSECWWPDWPCGWRLEVVDGVSMGALPGEQMRPINPNYPN